jgi:hypothetical protein
VKTVATELEENRQSINFPSARTKLILCRKTPKRITEPNIPSKTTNALIFESEKLRSPRLNSAFTTIAITTKNGGRFDDVETKLLGDELIRRSLGRDEPLDGRGGVAEEPSLAITPPNQFMDIR